MSPADAEEATQALGQIFVGGWRTIALYQRLGVPAALGLSVEDWVRTRLGGYVRLAIEERRAAVRELTAQGLSTREAAGVLGVAVGTVHADRVTVQDRTPVPVEHDAGGALPVQDRTPDDAPFDPEAVLDADARRRLTDRRIAHQAAAAIADGGRLLVLEPDRVVRVLSRERLDDAVRYGRQLRAWFDRLDAAAAAGPRLLNGGRTRG